MVALTPIASRLSIHLDDEYLRMTNQWFFKWHHIGRDNTVEIDMFDGRSAKYSGITFWGTTEHVFWEAIQRYLRKKIGTIFDDLENELPKYPVRIRERSLKEARSIIGQFAAKIRKAAIEKDRVLRGNGMQFPERRDLGKWDGGRASDIEGRIAILTEIYCPEANTIGDKEMAGKVNLVDVMIASPSDVAEERQIIRDVIHEWNAVNTRDRNLVLRPIGWESHSSPEMGDRPQGIISRQILKDCDLLIAVFWTKFGSPTGKGESGTAEEIEEHLAAGKPAMLYFSAVPVVPDSIDPEQYQAVKAFERQKMSQGLIERYSTKAEFREKLSRHLAQTIIRSFGRSGSTEGGFNPVAEISNRRTAEISEAAQELLKEAAKDQRGVIMRLQYIGGSSVKTNGREFQTNGDVRSLARWRGAVDELERLGLIEDRGGKGEVFFVTNEGYEAVELMT